MADNWTTSLDLHIQAFLDAEAKAHSHKQQAADHKRDEAAAKTEMGDAKDALRELLEEAGVTADDTSLAKIILAKGRESVKYDDNFDVATLPVEFVKLERKPDATQIKAALARGESIKGARLDRGPSTVSIKVKETANG